MQNHRLTIRVDNETYSQLERLSEETGETESAIVRHAISKLIDRPRAKSKSSALKLAKKLKIVGAIKGLPCDLGTNPAHMWGFGK